MGVKLGQKWAVKDGNLLASNQVGSRFFNKEFDFSRASDGTYVDRDGLLKTAELYNLIPYSEDFSSWVNYFCTDTQEGISPNGNNTAYTITDDASGGVSGVVGLQKNGVSVSAASNYTFSCYVKSSTNTEFRIRTNNDDAQRGGDFDTTTLTFTGLNALSGSVEQLSNDWYRLSVAWTTGSDTSIAIRVGFADIIKDGSNVFELWGAQLVLGTEPLDYQYTNGLQGLPRISFEDGVGHLLLEPQRTNLILNANQYTGNTIYYTITSNQSSPDGENNATLFIEKTSTSSYSVNSTNASVVGGQTYTYSFFIKYAGKQNIPINATDGISGYHANVDILNGVVNSGTAQIEEYANGWYRISMTRTVNASASVASIQFGFGTQTGDGVSGFYLFGYQIEQGSYSTSYINTSGTSVTRLADVCNNSGSAQDFNSEEGVIFFECAALSDDYTLQMGIFGSFTEQIRIEFASGSIRAQLYNGAYQANMLSIQNVTDYNKIAFKYKENDFALWINGAEVATDNSGVTFNANTINKLHLAAQTGTSNYVYGKVRNLQVFTEALSDAELQQLTT